MLRIRLLRVGKKNRPSFRLVVAPRRSAPQTGRFLEVLGFYDPIKHTKSFKKDRIQYWLSCGASVSDTVFNILVSEGVLEGKKVAVHSKSKKKSAASESPQAPRPSDSEPSGDASGGPSVSPAFGEVRQGRPELQPASPKTVSRGRRGEPQSDPSVEAESDSAEASVEEEGLGEEASKEPEKEETYKAAEEQQAEEKSKS